ncbi:c6 zinc finger domain-containing protein [Stemphylium lycopersici]|nr:c6 zinc finger domain-containing protein [Stemphylium lycopersici]RAR01635.1 c6 zinc finger domain-containing protein [Stemphylium lycopersici]
MPANRSQSVNRQGRQKSCSECAKAKRKCGLEQPSCARCSRQHLTCSYPPQPRSQAAVPHLNTSDSNTEPNDTQMAADILGLETANLDFDFDISAMPTATTAEILDFDLPAAPSCFDSFPGTLHSSMGTENQTVIPIAERHVQKPFLCANLSSFAKSRAAYFVEHVKLAPTTMVEQVYTPWMHRMLYDSGMPKSLQEAHAACALYVTMNQTNAGHVIRFICTRAQDLINTPFPYTQIEILARTHALMLYLIMLIFGADIRFYTQVEALLPHLVDMGERLIPIAAEQDESMGPLPIYPSAAARSAWKSYMVRESARRTSLAAIQISVMYTLLSGQMGSCNPKPVLGNRVTLSAHLWGAANAFDFALAWNEKNHFVITEMDFTEVLEKAQPDDLDVFANMLLTGMHGIDDIRGWYYTRGGTLQMPPS